MRTNLPFIFGLLRRLALTLLPVVTTVCIVQAAQADSTIVLNANDLQQRIDGFGASSAWLGGAVRQYPTGQQNQILDLLFSPTTGAGLSLLRQRIPYDLEPSPGRFDFSGDDDILWLSKQAAQRGMTQVWSTPWSPPAWMKTNGDVNNGGELAPAHYQDYADYLAAYVRHEQAVLGSVFGAISLQNEPDFNASYESCLWSGAQFHDFLKGYLIPTFRRDQISTSLILPENSQWSDEKASETLKDPYTAGYVGVVATHVYGGTIAPFADARAAGKPVWETEVSNLGGDDSSMADGLTWAVNIHQCLTIANASAWHYWWLWTTPGAGQGSGQGVMNLNTDNMTYTVNKRLWTIGNFSRFVRPGFQRLTLSSDQPESNIYASAFRDPLTGKIAIVVINNTDAPANITVKTPVFSLANVTPYRTSATENLAPLSPIAVAGGQFITPTPPRSVTTYIGRGVVSNLAGAIRVRAGGTATGNFLDDVDYSGGTSFAATAAVDTSGVAQAAPMSVYQTQRYGRFLYTFPGLKPRTTYTVRLHFAETYWSLPRQRAFNVAINRQVVLKDFDALKAAGGPNRAVVETFMVNTGAATMIALQFTNGAADNAMVSGIEILPGGQSVAKQTSDTSLTEGRGKDR